MATILVESRSDPNVYPMTEAIAKTCRSLGYHVVRWRGPLSGRSLVRRWISRCETAILWNGAHPAYGKALHKLHEMGARVLVAELGWYPQTKTIQVDRQGINAAASWANLPLTAVGRTPLPVRRDGDLLLVLQLDDDTQITQFSPWFPDMRSFVEHVGRHSTLPVRVRAHPRQPPAAAVVDAVNQLGCVWDHSATFGDALHGCKAVACVNSSIAIEAMCKRIPALCYGKAIYRHAGVVVPLQNDPASTREATESLRANRCDLFEERIDEMVARVQEHQWTVEELPKRLPQLLDSRGVHDGAA